MHESLVKYPEFYVRARKTSGDGFGMGLGRDKYAGYSFSRRYRETPRWKRLSTAKKWARSAAGVLGAGWTVEVVNITVWLSQEPGVKDLYTPEEGGEKSIPWRLFTELSDDGRVVAREEE